MISAFSYLTCFAFRFLTHMFRLLSRSGDPWGNHAAAFCCDHHWLASLVDLSAQSLLRFWCNQYGPCFGIWRTNVPPVTFQQRSFRHPWGLSLTTRNLFAERDRQYFTAWTPADGTKSRNLADVEKCCLQKSWAKEAAAWFHALVRDPLCEG